MHRGAQRLGLVLTLGLLSLGLGFAVVWALGTGPAVSALNEYGASRIRRGLAWVVDPRLGVLDDGPLRILSTQTYTPLYEACLALLPASLVRVQGSLLNVVAWFGGIAWLTSRAPRARRAAVVVYSASFGCVAFFLRTVASLQGDTLAALCAAVALTLVIRARRPTAGALGLFVLAGFFKPNVLGVLLGVALVDVCVYKARNWRRWLIAGIVGLACLGALQWASHGAWFFAMRTTTQNSFEPLRLANYLTHYFFVLGLPQLVLAGLVLRAAPRDAGIRYGASGVVASVLWQAYAMGRHGSSTHYFLEPFLASVALLACGPAVVIPRALASLLYVATPVFVLAVSLPVARGGLGDLRRDTEQRQALLATTRALCPVDAMHSWMSSAAQTELAGTGKVSLFDFGTMFALRRGELRLASLEALLLDPANRCFVHTRSLAEPVQTPPATGEIGLYDRELRPVLLEHYELRAEVPGYFVYVRR